MRCVWRGPGRISGGILEPPRVLSVWPKTRLTSAPARAKGTPGFKRPRRSSQLVSQIRRPSGGKRSARTRKLAAWAAMPAASSRISPLVTAKSARVGTRIRPK